MANTEILSTSITTSGGEVLIDIDVEFGISTRGTVGSQSYHVFRGKAMVSLWRNGTLLETKKFGQYMLDGDVSADARFDVYELSGTGVFKDNPPAGTHTYKVTAHVDQISTSSSVVGFLPTVEAVTFRSAELKK